jgi:hypothetical protein
MRGRCSLELTGDDPSTAMRAEFPASGLLFLSSDRSAASHGAPGLLLVDAPREGELLYVLLLKRRRSIVGVALRPDARLPRGALSPLRAGDAISIGRQSFRVAWGAVVRRERKHPCWRIAALAAAVLCAAGHGALLQRDRGKAPSAPTASAQRQQSIVRASQADRFVEEARRSLREGRTEQARLALVQAAELDANAPAARELLAAIDQQAPNISPHAREESAHDERVAEAQRLFEEGLGRMRQGDLSQAQEGLDAAAAIVRAMRAPPPFAADLDRALRERDRLAAEAQAPRIAKARAFLDASRGRPAPEAAATLASAMDELKEAAKMGRSGGELAKTMERVRKALAAAGDRWLASARASEGLAGCNAAGPLYRRIAGALAERDEGVAAAAQLAAARCAAPGEAR